MQSHQGDELLQARIGIPAELLEEMPARATHHVIGKVPAEGDEIIINGLVWIVELVRLRRGRMRLRLKKFG